MEESDPQDPENFEVHPDEDYGARFYKTDSGYTLEVFTPVFRVDLTGSGLPDATGSNTIGWKSGSQIEARDEETRKLFDEIRENMTAQGGRRRRRTRKSRKTRRRV